MMRKTGIIKIYRSSAQFFFVITFFTVLFVAALDLKFDLIGLTFAINLFQASLLFSFFGAREISLIRIYYFFSYIFFSLIPWLHYTNDVVFWGGDSFSFFDYLKTNIIIFASNLLVIFVYYMADGFRAKDQKILVLPIRSRRTDIILIALAMASFVSVFYLNNFSITSLLFRGLAGEIRENPLETSSVFLLVSLTSRLIPFFCLMYAFTANRSSHLVNLILFLILLACVFPTGVPRYMVGFVYIPTLLTFISSIRFWQTFLYLFIFSLTLIFPFLNQFRNFERLEDVRFIPSPEFFYAGHFDAYQSFARALQVEFISYGYQILGSLFFFVPRLVWPEKPVGSGSAMAQSLSYVFDNISMPFLAEGYVNFGLVGIAIFSVAIATGMAKLDARNSSRRSFDNRISYKKAIYYYLCGALFFVLRGDLLSSFAYLTAGIFSAAFVKRVCKFIN